MSLISAHLEQISFSCQGIDSLPYVFQDVALRRCSLANLNLRRNSFPQPKIFTNALLSNHDITSLIRDTEPHERALFSVPPPPPPSTTLKPTEPEKKKSSHRRQTVFNVTSGEVTTGPPTRTGVPHNPRRHTAVSAVLGGQMHDQLRRGEQDRKGDVDLEGVPGDGDGGGGGAGHRFAVELDGAVKAYEAEVAEGTDWVGDGGYGEGGHCEGVGEWLVMSGRVLDASGRSVTQDNKRRNDVSSIFELILRILTPGKSFI
ncbi:hypothetical protein AUP68_00995 [Ilyonectria robusta]